LDMDWASSWRPSSAIHVTTEIERRPTMTSQAVIRYRYDVLAKYAKSLKQWCRCTESSGIGALVELSQRLRSYA
jgi:hypothetical protein